MSEGGNGGNIFGRLGRLQHFSNNHQENQEIRKHTSSLTRGRRGLRFLGVPYPYGMRYWNMSSFHFQILHNFSLARRYVRSARTHLLELKEDVIVNASRSESQY
jgi:hypothetical protein